ncbi:MAG: arsenite efflux transporter metallochaperone ArsD [Minicystis sp.]
MHTIRIFDPAMCCSTGVCGPTSDPELARFAADVDWLQKQGVTVERFNLSAQPAAFAETPVVREALARGTDVLPLVLVDDRIAVEGSYPSRETLAALAGVVLRKLDVAPAASGCCGPSKSTSDTKAKTGCC